MQYLDNSCSFGSSLYRLPKQEDGTVWRQPVLSLQPSARPHLIHRESSLWSSFFSPPWQLTGVLTDTLSHACLFYIHSDAVPLLTLPILLHQHSQSKYHICSTLSQPVVTSLLTVCHFHGIAHQLYPFLLQLCTSPIL